MDKCKLCGIKKPLVIAGAATGLGILGNKLNFGGVVSDQSSNISSAGSTLSSFVAPAVNISAGGYVIKQLRGLHDRHKKMQI